MGADGAQAAGPRHRVACHRNADFPGLRGCWQPMGAGAGTDDSDEKRDTRFATGLQAMSDPPRRPRIGGGGLPAGIAVKMITGHHAGTATHRKPGGERLDNTEPAVYSVLTVPSWPRRAQTSTRRPWDTASVFARVSSEQKLRLVQALQARGHVVG